MTRAKWHGWLREGSKMALHVGPLPRYKRFALYAKRGNHIYSLAWFVDEGAARKAMEMIDAMTIPLPSAAGRGEAK